MMKAAPVPVKIISIQEAWRRGQVAGGGGGGDSTRTPGPQQQPPTRISVIPTITTIPSPAGLQIKGPPPMISSASFGGKCNGNPCLDLFFHSAVPKEEEEGKANFNELGYLSREYLNQLLPAAWSRDPLTTLKVIFNLGDREDDDEAFYTAGYWLHQNHPKTLAANLPLIAGSYSNGFGQIAEMMHRIRLLEVSKGRQASPAAAADYLSLHDRISDRMARCFKSGIETLGDKQNRQNLSTQSDYCEELWFAEEYVRRLRYWRTKHPVLFAAIAKKLFPRESDPEYQDLENGYYTHRVRMRLVDDILEPLERLVDTSDWSGCEVVWYPEHDHEEEEEEEHLKQFLPEEAREILENATDSELGKPAEFRLAIYSEEKQKQQGKLNNCLPVWVLDPRGTHTGLLQQVSLALTALVSQLAEEPWKGKVVSLGPKNHRPRLLTMDDQGGHGDLSSKRAFLKGLMDESDLGSGMMIDFDFHKVFDLILQVAVDQNLKPGQMIKRVFVFTTAAGFDFKWEIHDYEAVKSRFKDKGYEEDVVPRLVFWSLGGCVYTTPARSTHNGLAILSGYDYSLLKSFLDNDGDIGLDHVMEAAISGQKYDGLVVLD